MNKKTGKPFHQRRCTNANQLKRCSMSLATREMKTITTMRYHYMPIRMTKIIKKRTPPDAGKGCAETGSLTHCWWKLKVVQPLYSGKHFGSFL